jgi:hypothetical protein
MGTYSVKAKAPPRTGYAGYWSAQRHFPAGETLSVTVDARELRELLDDDTRGLLMVEDADGLREQLKGDPDAGSAPRTDVSLTQEELAALEAFRQQKAQGLVSVQVPVGSMPASPPTSPSAPSGAAGAQPNTQVQDRSAEGTANAKKGGR